MRSLFFEVREISLCSKGKESMKRKAMKKKIDGGHLMGKLQENRKERNL